MPIGSSVYPPITISGASNEKITPVALTLASTEYVHVLQNNLTQVRIRCRGNANLNISFKVGETSTNYWSIPRGCTDNIDGIGFSGKSLYIMSDKPGMIAEIMELYL